MIDRSVKLMCGAALIAVCSVYLTFAHAFASVSKTPSVAAADAAAGFRPPAAAGVLPAGQTQDQIRAMIASAWRDAISTWTGILGTAQFSTEAPNINFVQEIAGTHCYGLYAGEGPVYCSGNSTVFVSIAALERLGKRHKGLTGAGMTFLVAHELGHHIQKINGRFQMLSMRMRRETANRRELAMHFELEADCLAGVWAGKSQTLMQSPATATELRAALALLGDDNVQLAATGRVNPATFTHGSSQQRQLWFEKGFRSGELTACAGIEAVE